VLAGLVALSPQPLVRGPAERAAMAVGAPMPLTGWPMEPKPIYWIPPREARRRPVAMGAMLHRQAMAGLVETPRPRVALAASRLRPAQVARVVPAPKMGERVEKVAMPSRLRQRVDRLRPQAAMVAPEPGRPEPAVLAEQPR